MIDAESNVDDIKGLVAQLRDAINQILLKYGHIPMVRSLCNMILDLTWYPGKIIICGTLYIIFSFIVALWVYAWQVFGFDGNSLFTLAMYVFALLLIADCIPWPYKSLKPLSTLTGKNYISELASQCPCLQE
jgi:hypothetical protein